MLFALDAVDVFDCSLVDKVLLVSESVSIAEVVTVMRLRLSKQVIPRRPF